MPLSLSITTSLSKQAPSVRQFFKPAVQEVTNVLRPDRNIHVHIKEREPDIGSSWPTPSASKI